MFHFYTLRNQRNIGLKLVKVNKKEYTQKQSLSGNFGIYWINKKN